MSTHGRLASLDLRLVDRDPGPEPGKIVKCADEVAAVWRERKDHRYRDDTGPGEHPVPGALQVVFCDLGTPSSAAHFQVYSGCATSSPPAASPGRRSRSSMTPQPTPPRRRCSHPAARARSQSSLVHGPGWASGPTQTRLYALHHLDVPWRPCDMEQADGRGLRQGNQHDEIRILRYTTAGPSDSCRRCQRRSSKYGYRRPPHGTRAPTLTLISCTIARFQLQPLVEPQPSQT